MHVGHTRCMVDGNLGLIKNSIGLVMLIQYDNYLILAVTHQKPMYLNYTHGSGENGMHSKASAFHRFRRDGWQCPSEAGLRWHGEKGFPSPKMNNYS